MGKVSATQSSAVTEDSAMDIVMKKSDPEKFQSSSGSMMFKDLGAFLPAPLEFEQEAQTTSNDHIFPLSN